MKCQHCGNDAKKSERTDGKCPRCQQPFVFDPTNGDPFTDMAFLAAIQRVSSQGTVKWKEDNLYFECCRTVNRRSSSFLGVIIFGLIGLTLSIGSGCSIALWLGLLILVFVSVICGFFLLSIRYQAPPKLERVLSRRAFQSYFQRWITQHGTPQGYLSPRPIRALPKPTEFAPDLMEYSFDRAVICDRDETVDILIANQFHFENNCAILGVDGYPVHAFDLVRRMLKNNPRLEVYALHDIDPRGLQLANRLATQPDWFAGLNLKIVDVGLHIRHAKAFRGLWEEAVPLNFSREGLSASDAEWLSKYRLSLSVIRPEQLIKRLFRAMNHAAESGSSGGHDSIWVIDGGDGFISEASSSDGGGDSFG